MHTSSKQKTQVRTSGTVSCFDNIPTYEDWNEPNTGHWARLKEELDIFDVSHHKMIGETFSPNFVGHAVNTRNKVARLECSR